MSVRTDKETGASLLSVLVIVMLMSTAAIAATDALARAVLIAKSSNSRAETFWVARGAANAAASRLTDLMKVTEGVLNLESDLLSNPVTLPAGRGMVVLQAQEASNCFNLNALIDEAGDGGVSENALAPFETLLVAAGLNNAEAQSLGQKLADWVDADFSSRTYGAEDGYYASQAEPYRAANTQLRSISELRSVAGFDADVRSRVEGLLCLRPGREQSVLNINTLMPAQAPLLVSLFSGELTEDDARSLIESRPTGGWLKVDDFLAEDVVNRIAPDARNEAALSIKSSFLAADMDIGTGDLVTGYQALYQRAESGDVALISLVRREF
jgi:general secretion pathway protein K